MAAFINPLEMRVWLVQVFAGSPTMFGAIALIVIAGVASFFRMNGVALSFMIALFFFMFAETLGNTFISIFAIIGGLLIGFMITQLVKR